MKTYFPAALLLLTNFTLSHAEQIARDGVDLQFRQQGKATAQASLVSIDGCNQKRLGLKLAYKGGSCDKGRLMNSALADFLKSYLPSCLNRALQSAAKAPAKSITFIHHGVAGDKAHTNTSWHGDYLAIDLIGFEIDGQKYLYRNRSDYAFFESVRKCWATSVEQYARKSRKRCFQTAEFPADVEKTPSGTVGREDANHKNHLHLSLPCHEDRIRKYPAFDEMDWALDEKRLSFPTT